MDGRIVRQSSSETDTAGVEIILPTWLQGFLEDLQNLVGDRCGLQRFFLALMTDVRCPP